MYKKSSHSGDGWKQFSNYDNVRGFDPTSEDNMNDNGISRYIENDDEEWE